MFNKLLAATILMASHQVTAKNLTYNFQENIVQNHSEYYQIYDTKYLADKNEFNTSLDELNNLQITPYWINQTGIDSIPQPGANQLKVCIIDSGSDSNHVDLPIQKFDGNNNQYSGFWGQDDVGHGTHIAGIISAIDNNTGIRGAIDNSNVQIHIEKLVRTSRGKNSVITDDNIIEAIESCAAVGSKVINLSLSSPDYSNKLRTAIDNLTYQNDIIFVAAAGNHGLTSENSKPAYPAAYKNVISVGAVDINNDLASFTPSYRNIDVLAPGVDILSTVPERNNKVSSVYYESDEGFSNFEYYQIDTGLNYPSSLPQQSSCYHSISYQALTEQIIDGKLSQSSIDELNNSKELCENDGGEVLVLSYNFLETLDDDILSRYDTWLTSMDFAPMFPTLLMPGLNEDEISFFKEGNVKIITNQQKYAALSGTSQSAAIVTAGIAKMWANSPFSTREQVINSVKATTNIFDLANSNAGTVDFNKAYTYLNNYDTYHQEPSCPEDWYDNKEYQVSERVTYRGSIYSANYVSKQQAPDPTSNNYGPWEKVGDCTATGNNSELFVNDSHQATYEFKTEERIVIIYKCDSYVFSCGTGGGGFGGYGGVIGFGGGSSAGGSYGGGEGGGGGNSSDSDQNNNDSDRQKEYDDLKKRADNKPEKKPGETEQQYRKRLAEYYKKVADDLQAWDDKYNKGRHKQKIQDLRNRSNNYFRAYQNQLRHQEAKERYKNNTRKNPVCSARTRGIVKLIQTLGCIAGGKEP